LQQPTQTHNSFVRLLAVQTTRDSRATDLPAVVHAEHRAVRRSILAGSQLHYAASNLPHCRRIGVAACYLHLTRKAMQDCVPHLAHDFPLDIKMLSLISFISL
jgi:hypothetical protein